MCFAVSDVGFQPTNEREIELVRELKQLVEDGNVIDRNMHDWWAEYTGMMTDYVSKRNASLCTDPEMLNDTLTDIKNNVEKVILLSLLLLLQFYQNNFDFFELDSQALLPSVPCNILKAASTRSTIKMLRRER